jgi:MoxR-like ATPase
VSQARSESSPLEEAKSAAAAERVRGHAPDGDLRGAEVLRQAYRRILDEVGKRIVGQREVIDQLLIAIFAGGHCLMEGVPGLAKTAIVSSLSRAMDLSFKRIQFTPDLMPSDITGTDIIQEDAETHRRRLVFLRGPVFSQMILADEINRTPPKTQAALLQAMQENTVTVGDRTYELERPFFVLATQNPLEHEGTYPLPEAQQDRFMFLVRIGYPGRDEEREILERTTTTYEATLEAAIDGPTILECQALVRRVLVPEHVYDAVLDLVRRSRPEDPQAPDFVKRWVEWGAGPRAAQFLVLGGKARAILQGRFHVTTEDLIALAPPVLRHRIRANFHAQGEGVSSDAIIGRLLEPLTRKA